MNASIGKQLMAFSMVVWCFFASFIAAAGPLPSWNEGKSKRTIMEFVHRVTNLESPEYVPPSERVAVFDNDGTLWAEQPMYFQGLFAVDRVKAMRPQHPDWEQREPFSSVLEGNIQQVMGGGEQGLAKLIAATHSGMTTEEFSKSVDQWLATARHPETGLPFTEMVYQPMLELLGWLRANGFKTFIVSGGGIEFMRVFSEKIYGIPPEQVIGSYGKLSFETEGGRPVLRKLPEIELIDDHKGKPVGIQTFIGRRPILAFGNSDGDLQMLQWTTSGDGARLGVLIHHTDAEREWAYDRLSRIGKLDKALDEAVAEEWVIIDMKEDWSRVFQKEKNSMKE